MAKKYIDDTTTQEFADMEAQREDQQDWWENEYSEAHLCAMVPAAAEYFRALHMGDIPF